MAWLSFIDLDKLWSMWSDWLVVCDCGFSLSALWCPFSAPTMLLEFLLPWTWGISSRLLQQSSYPSIKKKFKKAPRLLLLTNIEQEGQDKIYSPICKQIDQVDKNIWNNGFQITEFQAMKDSDTWEAGNKVRLTTVPYHCLKRVSRMCHRKREFRLSR